MPCPLRLSALCRVQILLTANDRQEMLPIETRVIALECLRDCTSSDIYAVPFGRKKTWMFGRTTELNAQGFREKVVLCPCCRTLPLCFQSLYQRCAQFGLGVW